MIYWIKLFLNPHDWLKFNFVLEELWEMGQTAFCPCEIVPDFPWDRIASKKPVFLGVLLGLLCFFFFFLHQARVAGWVAAGCHRGMCLEMNYVEDGT